MHYYWDLFCNFECTPEPTLMCTFLAVAQMTEGNNGNNVNKQKLALVVSKIFGFNVANDGKGYIRNLMMGQITEKHKEKVAKLVEEAMPKLAEKIKKL